MQLVNAWVGKLRRLAADVCGRQDDTLVAIPSPSIDGAKEALKRFRRGLPAVGDLADIVNAGWLGYLTPNFWDEKPTWKDKKFVFLNELVFKSLDVTEFDERARKMPLKSDKLVERLRIDEASPGHSEALGIIPCPDLDDLQKKGTAAIDLRLGRWLLTLRQSRATLLEVKESNDDPPAMPSLAERLLNEVRDIDATADGSEKEARRAAVDRLIEDWTYIASAMNLRSIN